METELKPALELALKGQRFVVPDRVESRRGCVTRFVRRRDWLSPLSRRHGYTHPDACALFPALIGSSSVRARKCTRSCILNNPIPSPSFGRIEAAT